MHSLVVDGASGSHSVSIGSNYTEVGGAMEGGWRVDQWLQVVVGVVCGVVCDPGSHVISCALTQHKLCDLRVTNGTSTKEHIDPLHPPLPAAQVKINLPHLQINHQLSDVFFMSPHSLATPIATTPPLTSLIVSLNAGSPRRSRWP